MKKKRLAIITTHPIQYNAPLFELLKKRNNLDVHVFYTWGESVLHDKFDPGFGRTINWDLELLRGYDFTFLKNTAAEKGSHHYRGIVNPELIEFICEWGADAILVYGWNFHSHLKVLRHFRNKAKILFRGDSNFLDPRSFIKTLLRKIYLHTIFKNVDVALFAGIANRVYFEKVGIKKQQLIFMPHAIDNARFAQTETSKAKGLQLRRHMSINEEIIVFLFAGKLEEKKDPALLLNSFTELQLPNAALIVVGNGPLEHSLKEKFGKVSGVYFLDFQNQSYMPGVYQAADIFVLPSIGPGETWGLAVNEAMAAAKAVLVSSAVGCAADLVKNNINGKIFEAGNKEVLKYCMNELSGNKAQLKEMGYQSLKIVENFNFENQAVAVEKAILE